jgi:GTP-binding protein EngB required for normal cell division
MSEQVEQLERWHKERVRPFVAEYMQDKVAGLDEALVRIRSLNRIASEELAICFLGASGVGKSTLINALVAGQELILPSGGIGPLTALAMEVRYDTVPAFEAEYHVPGSLWQGIIFPLERGHAAALKASTGIEANLAPPAELGTEGQQEPELVELVGPEDSEGSNRLETLRKQAQLIVKGNQDSYADLPYLVDSLREAAGMKRSWGTLSLQEDQDRIRRVKTALTLAKTGRRYRCELAADASRFRRDLHEHASGFLAPLIRELHVRWNSPLLCTGMVLVDLPGVGVAGDAYKQVTREWINKKAKGLVLVVDRAGITEASADLLRTSDFLTRLLFSADERSHDPVVLAVAMARLDDVAEDEWAKDRTRKKADHLAEQFDRARALIRSQLRQELERVWESGDEHVRKAQHSVIEQLCNDLLVFPLSAPQYRRLLANDPDDMPFIRDIEQSGIPAMQRGLTGVVAARRDDAHRRREESVSAWVNQTRALIELVRSQWAGNDHTEQELKELERELETVLGPLRKEFLVRQGQFREFLKKTMAEKIGTLVMRAKDSARKEIKQYLLSLKDAHWATLRAAVRKEGAFLGARHINLPDDFARKFVEPVAEVWGKSIIQEIRKRTREFAADCERMVTDLAKWCREQGARVPSSLLDAQLDALRADIKQIDIAGREVIDGLRDRVKNDLASSIQRPIKNKCNAFVKKGDDIGRGVKQRILELFDELAEACTDAAADAAHSLLLQCFKEVETELQHVRKDLENPLDNASDAILQAHCRRIEKADLKKRASVLESCDAVLSSIPDLSKEAQRVGAGASV